MTKPDPSMSSSSSPPPGLEAVVAELGRQVLALRQELAGFRARRQQEPPQLLSQRQAAKALGVGRDTVALLVQGRKVKTTSVNGRLRIPRAEIERLIHQGIDTLTSLRAG